MNEVVPLLLAAGVLLVITLAFVTLGLFGGLRDRVSVRRLVVPLVGLWAIFLVLAWVALLLPGASEALIFVAASAALGVAMLLYTRRANLSEAAPANRPEFWVVVIVGSLASIALLLASSR